MRARECLLRTHDGHHSGSARGSNGRGICDKGNRDSIREKKMSLKVMYYIISPLEVMLRVLLIKRVEIKFPYIFHSESNLKLSDPLTSARRLALIDVLPCLRACRGNR